MLNSKPIMFTTAMVQAIMKGLKTQTRRVIKPQPRKHHWENVESYELKPYLHGNNLLTFYHSISKNDVITQKVDPFLIGITIRLRYMIGQELWVKETWQESECFDYNIKNKFVFRADCEEFAKEYNIKWKSPLFMPRKAARLFLRVKNIRVEPIQEISDDDCCQEGINIFLQQTEDEEDSYYDMPDGFLEDNHRYAFANLWNSLHAKPKPVYREKKIHHYESYPWNTFFADKRETINGKSHYCYPNPWVAVYEFERIKK